MSRRPAISPAENPWRSVVEETKVVVSEDDAIVIEAEDGRRRVVVPDAEGNLTDEDTMAILGGEVPR